MHRVNPVLVNFQGTEAKRDRQRLLLYRIFANRLQITDADIESLVSAHVFVQGGIGHPAQMFGHGGHLGATSLTINA
jgi:hypothetical protein